MHKDPTYCLVNPLNFNKTNLSCIWCCSGGLETDVQFFWTTFFVLQVNHTETCYMSVIVTNVISFASLTCGVFLSRKRNKWQARWLREIRNKLVSVQLARCVESEVELWQGMLVTWRGKSEWLLVSTMSLHCTWRGKWNLCHASWLL